MTSKEEQEVKRLKLIKEKQQNIDQQGSESKTLGATEVSLPGIPAGPTKVGNGNAGHNAPKVKRP